MLRFFATIISDDPKGNGKPCGRVSRRRPKSGETARPPEFILYDECLSGLS